MKVILIVSKLMAGHGFSHHILIVNGHSNHHCIRGIDQYLHLDKNT